ncbi:hypothetical protein M0R45_008331 [Rubus argutus]|uniref:26S proteasome non-ATPase regulatory subunit 1/RPN2 N-terminal domain-containing protein n=1 Tax=Rubus argutus TaxID=59490 RepID=A0AAW1Y1R9_RUBAR
MATLVSSAGGLFVMLNESHLELKVYALSNLNKLVDGFWPEISTSVPIRFFYYLGELNDPLCYALGAGS